MRGVLSRGYFAAEFTDAWTRYIPEEDTPTSVTSVTSVTPSLFPDEAVTVVTDVTPARVSLEVKP